jgi:CHAT domain-containing protein
LYAGFAPSYNANLLASASELEEFEIFRSSPSQLTENTTEVIKAGNYLNGDTYLGDDASEKEFKNSARDYSILHLAMHALINDKNPLSSTLIFTKTNDSIEDDYLHTYEIYNMKLNADLAVLSACNTADGVLQSGEGIMSLSRAFMFAGVNNIVSTLWPANDATSSQLMEIFFKNIKEGIPLATALRNAKLTFLKTTDPAHAVPYYWANFILVGNNEPILLNQYSFWKNYGLWILAGLVLSLSFVWLIKKL